MDAVEQDGIACPRALKLIGGPLDGTLHEIQGFICPETVSLPFADGQRAEYRVLVPENEGGVGRAIFTKTEPTE